MIVPTGRIAERTERIAAPALAISRGAKSQPLQSQSFAAELCDRLGQPSVRTEGRRLGTEGLPPIGQPVTRQDPVGSNSNSGSSGSSGLSGLVMTYSSSAPTTKTDISQPSQSPAQAFDQSYWAGQPAAVQQLHSIQDPEQRAQLASQLQQQGYSIDVPIMVWGWDPATTMAARQSYGYTWVPSAGQQPVEVAPGLTFGGTSYNPNQPPPGSIAV